MLDVANGHTTRHRPSAGGVVVSPPDREVSPATRWQHRHLLDVDQLSRDELEACLDLAVEMRERRLRHAPLADTQQLDVLIKGRIVAIVQRPLGLTFLQDNQRLV